MNKNTQHVIGVTCFCLTELGRVFIPHVESVTGVCVLRRWADLWCAERGCRDGIQTRRGRPLDSRCERVTGFFNDIAKNSIGITGNPAL